MKKAIFILHIFFIIHANGQKHATIFEKSGGKETATYQEVMKFYQTLAKEHPAIQLLTMDTTDAGYPLHLVLVSGTAKPVPLAKVRNSGSVVILVNNGIHPGEPDGIDATMMLVRDIAEKKVTLPSNVILAVIPVYNIGGALNRNSHSRVNQQGPVSYGFRGNSRYLDLNRDFIKADAKETKAFYKIFHLLKPDIFLDNHVSDGADYQHTMTLLTTQHAKLGGATGNFLHQSFEPALYQGMEQKGHIMIPYVNFDGANAGKGWAAFYDAPRFASGYAALFHTLAFVAETHMLKPFDARVKATYDLMVTLLNEGSRQARIIKEVRKRDEDSTSRLKEIAVNWKLDSSRHQLVRFLGYKEDSVVSKVTGLQKLVYRRDQPTDLKVRFYNYMVPSRLVKKPKAYVIPQGWHTVLNRLKWNRVPLTELKNDTFMVVSSYTIADYKSYPRPYEGHHRNYDTRLTEMTDTLHFLKGDFIAYTGHAADRYLVETLEPYADDSFFSWNFFDAVLQRKEYYSDYRWEDVAAGFIENNPAVKLELEERKRKDPGFAANASAQLYFIYSKSPYAEPGYMRYPVFRLMQ